MKIDLHVHVADLETLLNRRGAGRLSNPIGHLARILKSASANYALPQKGTDGINERYLQHLSGLVQESSLDAIVLLALDAVYDESGLPRPDKTMLHVENDFVWSAARQSRKFIFGASVHPYRKDAVAELERVVKKGACLVKWIPSAQNIAPDDPLCIPFYELMAHFGIPLLTHTGIEHTLSVFDDDLNDPRRLVPALDKGVTVIAAHCGTRMYLHERSYFEAWMDMAMKYPTFYGDLSAFGLPVHGQPLRRILRDPHLLAKVTYGSDFPTLPMPLWYFFRLGWRKAMELRETVNPFDKALFTMRELGVPEEVFSRAESLLRLSDVMEV